jgi:signal transduction histidine kinase
MRIQPYRVHLSIASPSEIERTARELTTVRDDFLSTGSLSSGLPRPVILASWERCRTLAVNPSRRCAPLAVARETQLEQLRNDNALLIEAAHPAMSYLTDFLADSGYVVVLSDAQGRLLEVVGDKAIRRRLARIDFVPGGNWSEAGAGTNAIGTALVDRHVVQLMAAEHYCDGWQDLTCTAAPITHPLTNETIGILDVTGDYRLIRPFLTGLLAVAALETRQRLYELLTGRLQPAQRSRIYDFVMSRSRVPRADSIQTRRTNEMIMSQKHPTALAQNFALSDSAPSATFRQLNSQERRAYNAERLAAAAGIISASLDLSVTREKIVEQAAHLLGTEQAGIHLFDEEEQMPSRSIASLGTPSSSTHQQSVPKLSTLLYESGIAALVQERGEPVVMNDVLKSSLLHATQMAQMGIRSLLLLPLATARGISGFITVSRPVPYTWTIEEIHLGLTFATQSATALENARLFDSLQQHNSQIEALNTIAHLLSTLLDPAQHLDLVLKRIIEITGADAGVILLLDQQDDQLRPAAHYSRVLASLDSTMLPLHILCPLARRVIDLQRPLKFCADCSTESAISAALHALGLQHLLAVALEAGNALSGVLLIGLLSGNKRNKDDLAFFSAVGQQIGLALRNAQLLRAASEMEALREADRLKSGFLAAVSHDLRSPLTAIRASVESLLDADSVQSATSKEHLLHNIAGQANRLGLLVDQLLDLSRIEADVLPLDCDWVELPILIDDAVAEFTRLHGACHIEKKIESPLPLAYLDATRLIQVVWNLLENACKYAAQYAPIEIEAFMAGKEVWLSVADRGPGIPRSEHEKIFQRFYRLERDRRSHVKGSGLGLAICKGIVEAHRGRIWVEDRKGGGSIFYIALPLPTAEAAEFDADGTQGVLVV